MKLNISLVVLSFATASIALAQSDASTTASIVAAPAPATSAAPQSAAQTVTVTTIAAPTATVAPQVTATAAEIVKQPTTVVEAAPLTNSRADELRKSREQTEVETEQKIVEKLEQSRIIDEKRRQDKVLGSLSAATAAEVAPAKSEVAPAPAIVVVQPQAQPSPVAAVAPAAAGASKEEVQGIVKEELANMNKKSDEKKYFFSAGAGTVNYTNSPDVKNFGAFNMSFGQIVPSGFSLAGDFGYNSLNQNADVWGNYRAIDQYTLGTTGRFFLMTGRVRPSIGATVDYVRRQYSGVQGAYGAASFNNLGKMTSNSLDAGAVAALDVVVTDNISLAFEYRYMTNLTYKYDNQNGLNSPAYSYYGMPASPLEAQNYQSMMFVMRYTY